MVRVSDEEQQLLKDVAKEKGLPVASWARMELLRISKSLPESDADRDDANIYDDNNLELLSLFCGPGGLDEGFKQAGFTTAIAIDNDKECIKTFKLNHPSSKTEVRDIVNLRVADLDALSGNKFKPVGVLGGPPCQSFSISNVHQKEDDPRHLLPEIYASLLKDLNKRNPLSFFLFENVPGLLGKKHRHRYEKFKALFEDAGFTVYEKLLDAKYFGVPQERPRIFVVGINNIKHPGKKWLFPRGQENFVTVRNTIYGLPEPIYNSSLIDPNSIPVHPNHWCLVPRSEKFRTANLQEGQMLGRSFRTLAWDKPSWAVAYGHREVHVHPNGHRRLSIYEAMLLQTFPKSYCLTGNMSAQVRLISEAVPPLLAFQIANSIKESLDIS